MSGYRLLSETFPVARKQHRCIWCGELILPGEKYRHERSVYDGQMQDHKWHPECAEDQQRDGRETGEWEFIPHSAERPTAGVEGRKP